MNSYKDLDIYKLAYRLAIDVHKMTMTLPKYELYEQGSQVRRSSKALKIILLKALVEEGIKMNLFAFWFLRIHHVMKQFRN